MIKNKMMTILNFVVIRRKINQTHDFEKKQNKIFHNKKNKLQKEK